MQHSLSTGDLSPLLDIPVTYHVVQAHTVASLPNNGGAFQNPKLYARDEYGFAPVTAWFCFTLTNRHCHSRWYQVPRLMPVSPFTTDQNRFLPTPLTLNNGDIIKLSPSTGASKHIAINSRRLIRCFPAATK